ncbi:unnamed protein product [Schistosoma mattheei]|uniref:Uncharacterized protein n=1 Tax=Schistosoma mattheei TaxID=31246 RepID=A0A183NQT5_9TREM|nr:unnamed protein product [Schistosoma mattheei]
MDFTESPHREPERSYLHQLNFRRTIEDVRTRRGGDIALDHHLVVDIEAAHTDLPIDINPPTKKEIRMAIRQIKNGITTRPDNILAGALKSDIELTTKTPHLLFRKIWEDEQMPMKWKKGHLIKIPKKGDLSKCENHRFMTLLSVPGKFSNRVLLNRMKDAVDDKLRDQQAEFRKDRSCTDQIATLRIVVEQSVE